MDKYPDGLYVKDDKVTTVMAHPIINPSGTLLGMKITSFQKQTNCLINFIE
jgi:hypothetical protein